jgi:hypothetical protein
MDPRGHAKTSYGASKTIKIYIYIYTLLLNIYFILHVSYRLCVYNLNYTPITLEVRS